MWQKKINLKIEYELNANMGYYATLALCVSCGGTYCSFQSNTIHYHKRAKQVQNEKQTKKKLKYTITDIVYGK